MKSILLIDDDDLSRGAVHKMLERAGYQVYSTGDGNGRLTATARPPRTWSSPT
jgi:CheY-like chemotaxis protein